MTEKQERSQQETDMLGQGDTIHHGILLKAAELGFTEEEIENLRSTYGAIGRRNKK
ncbi:hypothetical protein [Cohaesibacter intestini]|uniref:hypothetical protein n=1 Tax=Cohaesibacter intestini TaxID=2211145 RepID=UPI00130068EC|nr:hypothetical protein [Cohaesibacter intestini]